MKTLLIIELMTGNMLRGWNEGPNKFGPTYKYCPNTYIYYGCCYHGKKDIKYKSINMN